MSCRKLVNTIRKIFRRIVIAITYEVIIMEVGVSRRIDRMYKAIKRLENSSRRALTRS